MTSAVILNHVVDFDFHAETQSPAYVSAKWEGNNGATEVCKKIFFWEKKNVSCFRFCFVFIPC